MPAPGERNGKSPCDRPSFLSFLRLQPGQLSRLHRHLFGLTTGDATGDFSSPAFPCFPKNAEAINPKTNGRKVCNNAGNSQRCANYLVKEAKEAGGEAIFFGAPGTKAKTATDVVEMLDGNGKGPGKDDPKFHSLVLSTSADELLLIGNNPKALEEYNQNVMGLYAKNFTLKKPREAGEENLVWAATTHQERRSGGTDGGVQGDKKDGLQTHIHVMVSARDADQKITLNPLSKAAHFNRVQSQAEANAQMEVQFGRVVALGVAAKKCRLAGSWWSRKRRR